MSDLLLHLIVLKHATYICAIHVIVMVTVLVENVEVLCNGLIFSDDFLKTNCAIVRFMNKCI